MTLYDLLKTMQDVRIELHIYKNHTFTMNEKGEAMPCVEIEKIADKNNQIFLNISLNRYNHKYNMKDMDVFYIGYMTPRSKVLRVNCEIMGE